MFYASSTLKTIHNITATAVLPLRYGDIMTVSFSSSPCYRRHF